MATVLTLNTCLLDVRLFGRLPLYPPAPWIDARRRELAKALTESGADVICLQEVFRRPHRRDLARSLTETHPHVAGLDHPGLPLGTGLMVLSRHPIPEARPAEFRAAILEERLAVRMGFLSCRIDLPDLGPTRVINFHLSAGGLRHHPEAPAAEELRSRQIDELVEAAGTPGAERAILAGDLNAGPQTSRANLRKVLGAGFRDAYAEGAPPSEQAFTWNPKNPVITGEANRALPPQRIDHVFLRRDGAQELTASEAVVALHESRVDLADGRRVPLSDHYGLSVTIDRA